MIYGQILINAKNLEQKSDLQGRDNQLMLFKTILSFKDLLFVSIVKLRQSRFLFILHTELIFLRLSRKKIHYRNCN